MRSSSLPLASEKHEQSSPKRSSNQMHDQGHDGAVTMTGKTSGVPALKQANNQKSGVNDHVLTVSIAKAGKVTELFL